ncbi:EamA family transporter [Litorisediminicola beolgyonensis]|uniref:EamA/RhaT family transporter n=1 Tax=Litorisediminicola beolgyonensis TaxID=1173614 RepID=A0ABW3ZH20_9RHOB
MELWIAATLFAAAVQTLRFMIHKRLSETGLTTLGSTFARFAGAAPFAVILVTIYLSATGQAVPDLSPRFWAFAMSGALGQILATMCTVALFRTRNFATGITFKKTETLQTAVLGVVVLGEAISPAGWGAIGIGLAGVLLLSQSPAAQGAWYARLEPRPIALGVAAGAFFACSAVGYRGASLTLDLVDPLARAGVTLACVTTAQAICMAAYLGRADPAQFAALWTARRGALALGLTSMAGSLGWFTAFTLQTAAYVQALGQVELIFSLAASVLFFRERVSGRELAGMALVMLSILVLVLAL